KSTVSNVANTTKTAVGITAVGTAATTTAVALDSMNKAASFESQITKAAVKVGATKKEYKALSDEALRLGASSSLSSSEVAVAMDQMASKGFDVNAIIASMPGVISGAESSGEDLALTANTVVSALNAFGLSASQATRVSDIMAMSANTSAAGIQDLNYAFKYAAPDAKLLGISIEELSAVTGLLVDKGMAGEQAGTALRASMKSLANPSKEATKVLNQLGVTAIDSNGNFKSLAQITEDWNKATKGLTAAQKSQYATTVFGLDASSAMLNLFESGPEKIRKTTKALEESKGSAQEAAIAMKDNYAGAKEQLLGSLESAQIKFATPILPVVKEIFQGITGDIEGNLTNIEALGKKVASGLKDIFEPFSTKKPVLTPEIKHDPEAFAKYQEDLAKYTKFKNMDYGDKVVYALDEASAKAEEWLSGSGGESMTKIFTKLGEIAAKAWLNAFKTTVKSSASNLMDGNIGAAAGMGAAAWMLGGGAIAKGAYKVGKYGYGKVKDSRQATKATSTSRGGSAVQTPVYSSVLNGKGGAKPVSEVPKTATASKGVLSTFKNKESVKSIGGALSKTISPVTKVLGKVAMPLAAVGEVVNIARSNDKVKSTGEATGGLAGSLGGAKLGALIGTAIAPGIGTAIGGLLGGAGGYVAGKWLGGKTVDTVRGGQSEATKELPTSSSASASPQASATTANINMSGLQSAASAATTNMNILTSYIGQASGWIVGSFYPMQASGSLVNSNLSVLTSYVGQASGWVVGGTAGIQSSGQRVIGNLDILASYVGQASGWVAALSGIQSAAQRVISALGNLESRINSTNVKGGGGRTAYQ
ncbi:MAG TPA: phage tail tape measure protein, partial [Rummeliibacillus sp.]|nr:phage tail tape measure protein [Rummeliibacillus sp.]